MVTTALRYIRWFDEVTLDDVAEVGGKNASLGELRRELTPLGVAVPDGFAVTAAAFHHHLDANGLRDAIEGELEDAATADAERLEAMSAHLMRLVATSPLPTDLVAEIRRGHAELVARLGRPDAALAVRSSATAEDLPGASFAGMHESFLDVVGEDALVEAVRRCFASLYTARAIRYRAEMGFAHHRVGLSVGVQRMVRSGDGTSGVLFTLDTQSGLRDVVQIDALWGLGEYLVQGRVVPDEWYVHKATLAAGFRPILRRSLGSKERRLVPGGVGGPHVDVEVPAADRERFCLGDDDVLTLARWGVAIEDHYSRRRGEPTPMDVEFARDGDTGELFVVQARPETVHGRHGAALTLYTLGGKGPVAVTGLAVGDRIATGVVRVVDDASAMASVRPGDVVVTRTTDPDWEPVMRVAAAIVTETGGRTSHAAIVARELGIPAVVGAPGARTALADGEGVTVCCAEGEVGHVYRGALPFSVTEVDPATLPATHTKIMLNVGDPEQAFRAAQLPSDGIGLARMEFVFSSWVRVHPLALTRYDTLPPEVQREVDAVTRGYTDRREYFVDKLSQGIAVLAAAFHPRPVILRFSDFKTNEYAHLVGGASFEPAEENPMLGWRGASRYYHPDYRDGFELEVAAVKRVREEMGLTNLVVMIPFCRTPAEGRRVLETMAACGLRRGEGGLEVYVMAEIPSNIVLADRFAELFDGFSIGSNDLTQLTLGVDRDSVRVAPLFDERDESVRRSCAHLLTVAQTQHRKVGICGQAPSDYPEFAAFLVEHGIDSISLNPDALVRTRRRVAEEEKRAEGTG